jgi:hypothetical protein
MFRGAAESIRHWLWPDSRSADTHADTGAIAASSADTNTGADSCAAFSFHNRDDIYRDGGSGDPGPYGRNFTGFGGVGDLAAADFSVYRRPDDRFYGDGMLLGGCDLPDDGAVAQSIDASAIHRGCFTDGHRDIRSDEPDGSAGGPGGNLSVPDDRADAPGSGDSVAPIPLDGRTTNSRGQLGEHPGHEMGDAGYDGWASGSRHQLEWDG